MSQVPSTPPPPKPTPPPSTPPSGGTNPTGGSTPAGGNGAPQQSGSMKDKLPKPEPVKQAQQSKRISDAGKQAKEAQNPKPPKLSDAAGTPDKDAGKKAPAFDKDKKPKSNLPEEPKSSKDTLKEQKDNRNGQKGAGDKGGEPQSAAEAKRDAAKQMTKEQVGQAAEMGLDKAAGAGTTKDLKAMVAKTDENGDKVGADERTIALAKNAGRAANIIWGGRNEAINTAIDKVGDGLMAAAKWKKRKSRELKEAVSGKAMMDAATSDEVRKNMKKKRADGISSDLGGKKKSKSSDSSQKDKQSGDGEAKGNGIAKKGILGIGAALVAVILVASFLFGGSVNPVDGQPAEESDEEAQSYLPGGEDGGWYDVATWSVEHQHYDSTPKQVPWTLIMGLAAEQTDFGRYSPYDAKDRDPDRESDPIIDNDAGTGGGGGGGDTGNVNIKNTGDMDRSNPAWRQQIAVEAFVSAGFTPEQASGIVGNMITESGVEPTKAEIGKPFPSDWGWGLVQWTYGRNTAVVKKVKDDLGAKFYTNNPADLSDDEWVSLMETEVSYVIWELDNTHKSVGKELRKADSAEAASGIFLEKFEIPADIPGNRPTRAAQAEEVLKMYKAGGVDAIKKGKVAVNITPEEAEYLTFHTDDGVMTEMTGTSDCPVANPDPKIGGEKGQGVGPYLLTETAAAEARDAGYDPNSPCVGRWIADQLASATSEANNNDDLEYHDEAPWPYGNTNGPKKRDEVADLIKKANEADGITDEGDTSKSDDPKGGNSATSLTGDASSLTGGNVGTTDDKKDSEPEDFTTKGLKADEVRDFEDNVDFWETVVGSTGLFADRNSPGGSCELEGGADDDTDEAYSQQIIYSFHCEIAKESNLDLIKDAYYSTPDADATDDEKKNFEAQTIFNQIGDRYDAETKAIEEALQVSYTASEWDLKDCKADADVERAGLFMLTGDEMKDAGYKVEDRCDSTKSAAAAAKLFMKGEKVARDDRQTDDGPFQPALGGWDNISVAVGSEDRLDFAQLGTGTESPEVSDKCYAKMEDWVEHVAKKDKGDKDGENGFSDWADSDDLKPEEKREKIALGYQWSDERQAGGVIGLGAHNPPQLANDCPGGSAASYMESLGEIASTQAADEGNDQRKKALLGYANWTSWVRDGDAGKPVIGKSSLVERLSVYNYTYPETPLGSDNVSMMILNEIGGRDGFVPIQQRAVEYAVFFGGLSQPFDTVEKLYGSLQEAGSAAGSTGGDTGGGSGGGQGEVDAEGCPKKEGPKPDALSGGAEEIGINELCKRAVEGARSPEAAVALKWAFNQVGHKMYSQPRRMEDGYADCSSLVSRAYQEGAGLRLYEPGQNAWSTQNFIAGGDGGAPTVDSQGDLKPGDWYMPSSGHIVFIITDGYVLHASRSGQTIKIAKKWSEGYDRSGYIDPSKFKKLENHGKDSGSSDDKKDNKKSDKKEDAKKDK